METIHNYLNSKHIGGIPILGGQYTVSHFVPGSEELGDYWAELTDENGTKAELDITRVQDENKLWTSTYHVILKFDSAQYDGANVPVDNLIALLTNGDLSSLKRS